MKSHSDKNVVISNSRVIETFIVIFHMIDKIPFRFTINLTLHKLLSHIVIKVEYLFEEGLEQFPCNAIL